MPTQTQLPPDPAPVSLDRNCSSCQLLWCSLSCPQWYVCSKASVAEPFNFEVGDMGFALYLLGDGIRVRTAFEDIPLRAAEMKNVKDVRLQFAAEAHKRCISAASGFEKKYLDLSRTCIEWCRDDCNDTIAHEDLLCALKLLDYLEEKEEWIGYRNGERYFYRHLGLAALRLDSADPR